jgi:FtsZ-binding cell division protein ZapB
VSTGGRSRSGRQRRTAPNRRGWSVRRAPCGVPISFPPPSRFRGARLSAWEHLLRRSGCECRGEVPSARGRLHGRVPRASEAAVGVQHASRLTILPWRSVGPAGPWRVPRIERQRGGRPYRDARFHSPTRRLRGRCGRGACGGVCFGRSLGYGMVVMGAGEVAAAKEPTGPQGPVDVSWLILQRLDDLRRAQDDLRRAQDDLRRAQDELRRAQDELRDKVDQVAERLDAKIDSVRNWSLGLLLLAILGLLAKLLIPGA